MAKLKKMPRWSPEFKAEIYRFADMLASRAFHGFLEECESPIEEMFATAYLLTHWCRPNPRLTPDPIWIQSTEPIDKIRCVDFISPQRRILGYRVDFLVGFADTAWPVIVECDGAAFHKNAAKDDRRDRELRAAGYHVIRFTGARISADPIACVAELCTNDWRFAPDLEAET